MKKNPYVIVNAMNQFFAGDWGHIRWVEEYPDARLYVCEGNVIREALKLRVECDDDSIRAIADYGFDTESVLIP